MDRKKKKPSEMSDDELSQELHDLTLLDALHDKLDKKERKNLRTLLKARYGLDDDDLDEIMPRDR